MSAVEPIDPDRVRVLGGGTPGGGPVVYWMSRDQRAEDNWALLHGQELARERSRPLVVCFCLVPRFLGATIRQYGFMLRGLQELERRLMDRGIPFVLMTGPPAEMVPFAVQEMSAAALVTDFDPLRVKREWKARVLERITVPAYEVDAHNIVPAWVASQKLEWAAYTIRPKIDRLLGRFLTDLPALAESTGPPVPEVGPVDWTAVRRGLGVDRSVPEVDWLEPGEGAAMERLEGFLADGLPRYSELRNDPNEDVQSHLSPYLHFGQISAQRVALEVQAVGGGSVSADAFLEELIVRRELSDNFCLHNPAYDRFEGFPDWARRTLDERRTDPREHTYSPEEFEAAETHDDLWNAAQKEMVRRGKMHGYMRMYWAKKILEWSPSPEAAIDVAVHLNDRYELDGRDPNGYAGIAWSIGGVHDRAWGARPVFGKVRYMSHRGARSKFDVDAYVRSNVG